MYIDFPAYRDGRFPTGSLRLNPRSNQYRGLLYAGVAVNGGWLDLLTEEYGTIDSGLPGLRVGRYGFEIEGDGTQDEEILLPTRTFISTTAPFTICWQTKLDGFGTVNFPGLCSLTDDVNSSPYQILYSDNASYNDFNFGGRSALTNWGRGQVAMPSGISVTDEHWGVLTYNGAGDATLGNFTAFVNGRSGSISAGGDFGVRTDRNQIMALDGGSANGWDGTFKQFRVYNWEWPQSMAQAFYLPQTRWDVFESTNPVLRLFSDIAAAITGTAGDGITEAEVTAGGETIIITLTGDTFVAAGTGPIGSTADTQALIDGISAATSPALHWNAEWRDKEVTTSVVRTSDTVATLTMSSQAAISGSFDPTANETITVTVPAAVLTTSASPIVATPTFQMTQTAGGFIPYPNPRYSMHGGMQEMGGF